MNIIIHDREESFIGNILKDNTIETKVISYSEKIQPCICCFACWVKTPGRCIIKDGYDNMGELLSKCSQLTIISQNYYGGFSPFVKNVLDRSVCPFILPYFKTENGETRHPRRYKNIINYSVHFYGKITENEKETAEKLVKKIAQKHKRTVCFYNSFEEIKGV
ncbi:MAG: NAD(P)H-dependent oxidoreductase [Treponema sp.]|nr:NAD(P)H-dependent oxidoreductase [Treponema sp.]